MRVPLHPEDLLTQAAFKRIAKRVQVKWPGQSPINLSLARETLSRGLGYTDYHDAVQSSKKYVAGIPTPSESDIRLSILKAVIDTLHATNDSPVNTDALQRFVAALPLQSLSSFKTTSLNHNTIQTTDLKLDFTQTALCPVSPYPVEKSPSKKLGKTTKSLASPRQKFSQSDIEAIRMVTERAGNLRDQSLFSMFEVGLRAHHFLSAKVPTFSKTSEIFTTVNVKNDGQVHIPNTDALTKYIRSENLYPGDYLFHSRTDPKRPMSSDELFRIVKSWQKHAHLTGANRTPNTLRVFFTEQLLRKRPMPDSLSIANHCGHKSELMTSQYISKVDFYSRRLRDDDTSEN
jgi:integrase